MCFVQPSPWRNSENVSIQVSITARIDLKAVGQISLARIHPLGYFPVKIRAAVPYIRYGGIGIS